MGRIPVESGNNSFFPNHDHGGRRQEGREEPEFLWPTGVKNVNLSRSSWDFVFRFRKVFFKFYFVLFGVYRYILWILFVAAAAAAACSARSLFGKWDLLERLNGSLKARVACDCRHLAELTTLCVVRNR